MMSTFNTKIKYVFKELSSDSLVQTLKKSENVDEQIREAVISHFSDMVEISSTDSANSSPTEHVHHSPAFFSERDLSNIKANSYKDGYENGRRETTEQYEEKILELQQNNLFVENLNTKLAEFLPIKAPVEQYITLMGLALEELSAKLFVNLSSNQEEIIKKQLTDLLNSCYKGGKVIIKVNKKNQEFCKDLIDKSSLSSKIDLIEILVDSNLSDSDCVVEYNDTKLVFDRNLVREQIAEIVRHFTIDS